ncbi:nitroreductase family deazaflavin-dependent oxidoreductase [Microbacterium sp. CFBP9034]|uniref:nitroreductase family deazaflavin-dependent oxidoreductase n=1 Tax=Microbacterium sp. CFBP9034 TaxID=3096540 RepID=UPI002A6A5417|nr:nitroreductase family deazaflavin-dependent oxidoreductase [Microbacterium sp. CFBP9034]MDY0910178.1 nitroreductase family deazaflavin-dependent oxidoreductase [Microbacterium sp. CFBP9034]
MSAGSILRSAFGAALVVNAVPHGVSGVQGRPFPSPFGDPAGVGMSPPLVNVGWSAANAIAGSLLLRRGIRSPGEAAAATVGAVAMAAVIAYHFGDVMKGGMGLRTPRVAGAGGPPRALVKATEPIATALAGHRSFPLWAVIHHRGRKSGTAYALPVAVIPTSDPALILIGLPWGAETNWARNVIAAGEATLTWKGSEHATTSPRLLSPVEAATLAKPLFRSIVKRMPAAIVMHTA